MIARELWSVILLYSITEIKANQRCKEKKKKEKSLIVVFTVLISSQSPGE